MRDREERFNELDKMVDGMEMEEKSFVLWLLLREYSEKIDIPERIDTKEDYIKERFYNGIFVSCNHIIELLGYELWG